MRSEQEILKKLTELRDYNADISGDYGDMKSFSFQEVEQIRSASNIELLEDILGTTGTKQVEDSLSRALQGMKY